MKKSKVITPKIGYYSKNGNYIFESARSISKARKFKAWAVKQLRGVGCDPCIISGIKGGCYIKFQIFLKVDEEVEEELFNSDPAGYWPPTFNFTVDFNRYGTCSIWCETPPDSWKEVEYFDRVKHRFLQLLCYAQQQKRVF